MMVPSFEVTCCIAFSFSNTVCFGELVAALPASSFLVDEMDRAALEGYRAHQGQRELLRHLPKERHSAPQENWMNRQVVLVDEPSLRKGLGKPCAPGHVDVAAWLAFQVRDLLGHLGDRQSGMVPFQGSEPTGEHDLGVAVHQGGHLTGLRWPESGLLQIGGMADQDGVDLAQEGGGPRLLRRD